MNTFESNYTDTAHDNCHLSNRRGQTGYIENIPDNGETKAKRNTQVMETRWLQVVARLRARHMEPAFFSVDADQQ